MNSLMLFAILHGFGYSAVLVWGIWYLYTMEKNPRRAGPKVSEVVVGIVWSVAMLYLMMASW